jgi:hypothetical protein
MTGLHSVFRQIMNTSSYTPNEVSSNATTMGSGDKTSPDNNALHSKTGANNGSLCNRTL